MKMTLYTSLLIGFMSVSTTGSTDCRLPGVLYKGTRNITKSGRPCQRWNMQSPHQHTYDFFSLAQENFCRNFDREEPWCFTNNSEVRWELCGISICETPCLNQSLYSENIITQCASNASKISADCSKVESLLSCSKKNLENSLDTPCPGVEWRSIALQMKNIEMFVGGSFSECTISPCRRLLNKSPLATTFGVPCYRYIIKKFWGDPFCKNLQRFGHCVLSRINNETDSTCLVKDKFYLANKFFPLVPAGLRAEASLCKKDFVSEFPLSVKNTTGTSVGHRNTNNSISQTHLYIVVGLAFVILLSVSLTITIFRIRVILLRKRRKKIMRLPSIPQSGPPLNEIVVTHSTNSYLDPEYEIIEEQNEGFEHFPGSFEELSSQNLPDSDSERLYTIPFNAAETYLDVVHESNPTENININFESSASENKIANSDVEVDTIPKISELVETDLFPTDSTENRKSVITHDTGEILD